MRAPPSRLRAALRAMLDDIGSSTPAPAGAGLAVGAGMAGQEAGLGSGSIAPPLSSQSSIGGGSGLRSALSSQLAQARPGPGPSPGRAPVALPPPAATQPEMQPDIQAVVQSMIEVRRLTRQRRELQAQGAPPEVLDQIDAQIEELTSVVEGNPPGNSGDVNSRAMIEPTFDAEFLGP